VVEGLLGIFFAVMLAATAAAAIRDYWMRCPEAAGRGELPGLHQWMRRGLAVPIGIWSLWHLAAILSPWQGFAPLVPPLPGGRWASLLLGIGGFTVLTGLLWCLVTLSWILPAAVRGVRRRRDLGLRAIAVALPVVVGLAWAGLRQSWLLAVLVLTAGLWGVVHLTVGLLHVPQVSYLKAVARMKFGRYEEAEQEVLKQLEEKADDYEGWMMLASLYAERFGDLAGADQTVRDLASQEGLSDYHLAHAFTRLADWQLSLGGNPGGARAALSEIVQRCPGTPFAQVAQHRIRDLPVDEAEHRERQRPRSLKLPALSEGAAAPAPADTPVAQLDARTEAAQLEARLAQRPEDASTRERLARLLAERLGQVGPAIEQLQRLRGLPGVPSARHAEWIALEASWELRLRRREARARTLLEQLIREHPDSPQHLAARRQLELLDRAAEVAATPKPPPPPPRIRIPGFEERMKEEG